MKIILHADKKWGIGKKNDLMFNLPKDMKFFRSMTLNKVVCMGYNTLLSFPESKPLKNRVNIVLAPDGIEREDCIIVHSLAELFAELKKYDTDDVFVIGGAMFYKTMLEYTDTAYVTKVDADGGAEVFFPNLDEMPCWKLTDISEPVEDNGYIIRFATYKNENVTKY